MSGGKKTREVRDALLVNLSACKYPLVREAAERLGYEVVEDEAELWDLFWSDLSVSSDRVQRLLPFQRLNHFPGMLEICRKAALSRHMSRMATRMPAEYRFYPTSLVLPDQLDELMAALKRNKARAEAATGGGGGGGSGGGGGEGGAAGVSTFILKPSAGTQGRGIALVQYPHQLAEAGDVGSCVAQAYLSSPLLLDGFKFDLRVYALVLSVDPLRIHLYDEGLARLATEPYKPPSPSNLRSTTMHLTNYAVNKAAAGFVSADAAPAGGGSKRPMSAVLAQVAALHGTTQEALRGAIADVVNKTVMAIQPLLAHTYHTSLSTTAAATCPPACSCPSLDHVSASSADPTAPCGCPPSLCFELLGFDIIFDTHLQPWLLEVNHSPSFASDSRLDRAVKGEMLARAMQILGQQPEARRGFLEAEARAQSERLYNSPAGAVNSGGGPNASSSYTSVGAVMRRAQSALPRSRQLQAAAAALEEISANSAALLAAGGHVWGGGGGGGSASARGGYSRPASGGAAGACSPRGRQQQGGLYGSASGGAGTKRSLSFSSSSGGGSGGGSSLNISGGFKLVFPSSCDSDRKRYSRILQTAAELYPQQRCQCPWCARRREISLLAMSGQQLGLAARPPSAVSATAGYSHHGLAGHLPARPGSLSAHGRRSGLTSTSGAALYRCGGGGGAAAATPAAAVNAAVAGEDGGSDTEGSQGDSLHHHNHHHHHHHHHHHRISSSCCSNSSTSAHPGVAGSTGGPRSGGAASLDAAATRPRGKPPRPGGQSAELRSSSRTRGGPERQQSGGSAGGGPGSPGSPASSCSRGAASSSPAGTHNLPTVPSFPPPPTIASVLAGGAYGNGYGCGGARGGVLQQWRGPSGASSRSLAGEESLDSAGPVTTGYETGSVISCPSASSSGQLGRSVGGLGLGLNLNLNLNLGLGLGLGHMQSDPSDEGSNELQSKHSGGSNNSHVLLPEMYPHAGDDPRVVGHVLGVLASPRSVTSADGMPLAASAASADTAATAAANPHSRSNQLLGVLRPLSRNKSQSHTRLGSAPPHQQQQQQQKQHSQQMDEQMPHGSTSTARWSGRQGHGAAGGGSSVRSSGNSEAVAGSGANRRRDGGGDPWLRSRTAQRQRQQRGAVWAGGEEGAGTSGRRSKAPQSGGGNGGIGARRATQQKVHADLRRGCSADSPGVSSDEEGPVDGSSSLRRSFSCGELSAKITLKASSAGKAGATDSAALVHRPAPPAPGAGGGGAAAVAASIARPWLATPAVNSSGAVSGCSSSSPPAHFLGGHGLGALMPSSSRSAQGATNSGSGGGSEPGQEPGCGAAAVVSLTGPSLAAEAPGHKGASNGAKTAAGSRAPRFGGSCRRNGGSSSSSGATMSPAELELLLVRAKTTSALNNRYVAVYLQGGASAGGGGGGGNAVRSSGPRSPR